MKIIDTFQDMVDAFSNGPFNMDKCCLLYTSLIDAGHFETEYLIVEKLIEYLTPLFPDVEFSRAQSCKPLFQMV